MKIKAVHFWPAVASMMLLAFAQPVQAQYNVIKLDGIGIISPNPKVIRLSYERSIADHFSLLATLEKGRYASGESGSGSSSGVVNLVTVYEVKGWGLMPEARYYPFTKRKPAPLGFFIGIHYRYRFLQEIYNKRGISITSKGHAQNIGLNTGYKARAGRMVFDFLLGYGGGGGKWTSSNGDRSKIDPFFRDDDLNDFINFIRIEASVGFTFPKVERKDGR